MSNILQIIFKISYIFLLILKPKQSKIYLDTNYKFRYFLGAVYYKL